MKILWPPDIPPSKDYPRWFSGWLESAVRPEDVIRRHCLAGDIPLETYVPTAADAYLLRCALAELLIERGHACTMVGDRIQIELNMQDASVRAACGLK